MRAVLSAAVLLQLGGVPSAVSLVQVEQFGMAQCPMTSTLTTDFWNDCECLWTRPPIARSFAGGYVWMG